MESVDKGRHLSCPEMGRSYTLGVNLARVSDFTVLTVMDGTGKQAYHGASTRFPGSARSAQSRLYRIVTRRLL